MNLRLLAYLAVFVPAVVACQVSDETAGQGASTTVPHPGEDAAEESSSSGTAVESEPDGAGQDAAAAPSNDDDGGTSADVASDMWRVVVVGDPLCNASKTQGCYPDDRTAATAASCGLAPDGSASGVAGYADGLLACHVQPSGTSVQTVCTAAGPGLDGTACMVPTDCAPGEECVGTGTCQRYCCSGESQCITDEFCDIQTITTFPHTRVPVCMPIEGPGCGLLDPSACLRGETCTVVRKDGTTGCVAVGSAKPGDSCNTEYCGPNLVCLGNPGDRHCYTLCRTTTTDTICAAINKVCKGAAPLFSDPKFGVCQ
jgi:hypothetical protein